jgi:hypothetical protein
MFETSYLRPIESASNREHRLVKKSSPLDTSDIEGASPAKPKAATRPTFLLKNDDIEKSKPIPLIPTVVNRGNNLTSTNEDIEKSYPFKRHKFTTKRVLNPLNPDYQLPTVEIKPVTPPKLIRETNAIHDIIHDPDYPPSRKIRIKQRDYMNNSDIVREEKTVKLGKLSNRDHPDKLEVKDINNYMTFKSKRVTNPLSPRYLYDIPPVLRNQDSDTCSSSKNGNEQNTWQIGEMQGNHPQKLSLMRRDRPLFSLRTEDIINMKRPGMHYVPNSFPKERRQFHKINEIDDIEHVHPSGKFTTFAKQSNRKTNPLDPTYNF